MKIRISIMRSRLLICAFFVFGLGLTQSHIRISSILVGYRLGELKARESFLLMKRSQLKMKLSRLTTKGHLNLVSEAQNTSKSPKRTVALK